MQVPKPLVDDEYWFEASKGMVKNADANLNEAIGKLKNLILWLWGIYTASATAGATIGLHFFKAPIQPLMITLLASPSAILILAYCLAVCAEMPIETQFDPRIAKDIKMAYDKNIKSKTWRLYLALFFSLIAAILVSFTLKTVAETNLEIPPSFQARITKVREAGVDIALSGHFPKGKIITIRITPMPANKYPNKEKELQLISSKTTGDLQTSIQMDTISENYEISSEWIDKDNFMHCLKKVISQERNE